MRFGENSTVITLNYLQKVAGKRQADDDFDGFDEKYEFLTRHGEYLVTWGVCAC